jgi:peptidoglycan/xylan/chitin deacetylase (PgdA/CDA1 family)
MYRYKVSLLLEHVPHDTLKAAIVAGEENVRMQVSDPKRFLLQLDARHEQWINNIAATSGFDFDAYLQAHKPYMDMDQIQQLQRDGFTIGAHSVDHPAFASIAPISQAEQVKQSVQFVRDHCNVAQPAFAFPFTADGADPALFETMYTDMHVSRSFGTGGMQKQKYPNHIDRIPAEYKDWPLETIVKAEYHYFMAKKMIGK